MATHHQLIAALAEAGVEAGSAVRVLRPAPVAIATPGEEPEPWQ